MINIFLKVIQKNKKKLDDEKKNEKEQNKAFKAQKGATQQEKIDAKQ